MLSAMRSQVNIEYAFSYPLRAISSYRCLSLSSLSMASASAFVSMGSTSNAYALLVDPIDTKALAEAILKLLKDKHLYEEIARKGYEKAYSMFTWERIAESTLKIVSQW